MQEATAARTNARFMKGSRRGDGPGVGARHCRAPTTGAGRARFHGEITAPMTSWLGDWLNLLLRWTHFIAGIAWIGSSFYFIWLDRALSAPAKPRPGVEGEVWMVHSGGFYQTEKRRPGPGEMPAVLHWFKWEALFTWISGIALLVLIYYLSGAYLLDPAVSNIGRGTAIALGIALLLAGWVGYDLLWRSPLAADHRAWMASVI